MGKAQAAVERSRSGTGRELTVSLGTASRRRAREPAATRRRPAPPPRIIKGRRRRGGRARLRPRRRQRRRRSGRRTSLGARAPARPGRGLRSRTGRASFTLIRGQKEVSARAPTKANGASPPARRGPGGGTARSALPALPLAQADTLFRNLFRRARVTHARARDERPAQAPTVTVRRVRGRFKGPPARLFIARAPRAPAIPSSRASRPAPLAPQAVHYLPHHILPFGYFIVLQRKNTLINYNAVRSPRAERKIFTLGAVF
ncbi:hypothetical protein EVAR_39194_1 [Eumeta japonica]|uniref:Uncharacterized protein n=1 Tax=Eumeta variegata TaxID=151549 RepID=A0A4C1VLQ2_EUMVA|nr:hypothetical protein EVAR_39194_1 [Eumeta japonica]